MPSKARLPHRGRGISWSWERTRLPNLLVNLLHAATFGPTREVIAMVLLGVLLVLLGITVLVVEAHLTTAGVLGVAGTLSTATGVGLILAATGAPLWVTIPIAALLAIAGLVGLLIVAREVIVASNQEIRTGPDALIGQKAVVSSWSGREGHVTVAGVLWHAEPAYGWEDPLPAPGDTVVVTELDGLSVSVRRPHAWEVKPIWKPSSLSL